jgi:hypothetical protein
MHIVSEVAEKHHAYVCVANMEDLEDLGKNMHFERRFCEQRINFLRFKCWFSRC